MGLTKNSVGTGAIDSGLEIKKQSEGDKVIALAGNPNVGKSTLFNNLTGMNQHTGNWPGKTVSNAQGYHTSKSHSYVFVDIPGTYSLMAHSAEEEVARNFICFGDADAVVVVCDATCLERNLNLVLQTIEIHKKVIVCINLMDEAKRKKIKIDLKALSEILGVPVVGCIARKNKSIENFIDIIDKHIDKCDNICDFQIKYPEILEEAIAIAEVPIRRILSGRLNSRWAALKILAGDGNLISEINKYIKGDITADGEVSRAAEIAAKKLADVGIDSNALDDMVVSSIVNAAHEIAKKAITYEKQEYNDSDRKIDRLLTGKAVGYPVMILLLVFILWLTITGANYPSALLSHALFYVQDLLCALFNYLNAPSWLTGALVMGVYRVLAWVVSVMLPPMAIFFPLFTLLEDLGYLPRIAYNLDKPFKKCKACGKQALTMCMGFGCNAAGIVGARIIDSPRERLLAILTNNFVPCNGRFPALISIITMFFVGSASGLFSSVTSAIILTFIILFGIFATFAATKLLSATVLKGTPSSFTLELPPYRKPQIGKVIVRSIFDRTLFVLGRAVSVAAPAGLVIWLMANVTVGGQTLLCRAAAFLDPFASLMGLDGVILMAFILGFPANEIVIPIIIMAYMSQGSILELGALAEMKALFIENGWTWITAVSTMLFSLMHWPCSTTLITIKKETGSIGWTLLAAALPTAFGIITCMVFTFFARMF